MLTTLRNMTLVSSMILSMLIGLSIMTTVVSYVLLTDVEYSAITNKNKVKAAEYGRLLTTSIKFYATGVTYGKEYMKRFSIYNSTLEDYVALSAQDNIALTPFVSNVRVIYNISLAEVPRFEARMIELLKPYPDFVNRTSIVDLNDDKEVVPAGNRDWYCPLLFASPIDVGIIPGIDLCALKTFSIVERVIASRQGELVIDSRLTIRGSPYLDMVERTPQGFAVLTLNVNSVVKCVIEDHYVSLNRNNIQFYTSCTTNVCSNLNQQTTEVVLPNNESMILQVYFLPESLSHTSFLYVLLVICLVDITVSAVVLHYEVQRARYVLTDKMLGYVNHEIRNPLNCIHGLINIGITQLEDSEYIRTQGPMYTDLVSNFHTAQQACELLGHIVNDILDIKKLNDGKLIMVRTTFDINSMMHEVFKIVTPKLLENPSIEYVFRNPDNMTIINTDYHRLLQVLINFLTNAIKFTNTGSVTVLVERASDTETRLSVIDTGIGIEPAKHHNIFLPYEQNNIVNSLRHGGIGLGLFLCKGIVTQLNGRIGYESIYNVGSTFWVILPTS